ncbi:hypothetical protein VTL71DRAFT_10163 [Oculimacula yallundae]|uniref:Protein kinase domain-containing protein n=1 Tax=Oculimacula yallundae TaxID=86028 RepID=A0ABR4BRS6_9HELO
MDNSMFEITQDFDRTNLSDSNDPSPAPALVHTPGQSSALSSASLDIADVWHFVLNTHSLKRYRPTNFNPTGTLYNIGQGACYRVDRGEIYQEGGSGQLVAIKYLKITEHPTRKVDPGESIRSIETILRELRILTHEAIRECPNIVKILGYGSRHVGEHTSLCIVAEFASHGTLRDYLGKQQDPRVSVVDKIGFCSDIANGLAALHASGVAQGDMKLENTLVCIDTEGKVVAKLSDFGHSILDDESRYIGTAIFNAPEVRRGKSTSTLREVHFKSDIFSYGIMVWEIVQNGRRFLDTKNHPDPIAWLNDLPEDDLCRMALLAIRGLLPADGSKMTLLQKTLGTTLKDNPALRGTSQDVLKIFNTEREFVATERNKSTIASYATSQLDTIERWSLYRADAHANTVPFSIQKRVFKRLQILIPDIRDPGIKGRTFFELGMCYFYGFGVDANRDSMLACLREAASLHNPMAMGICHRLHAASSRQLWTGFPLDHPMLQLEHDLQHLPVEQYFSQRIRRHEKLLQDTVLAAPFDLYSRHALIAQGLHFHEVERISTIISNPDIEVLNLVGKSSLKDFLPTDSLIHMAARLGCIPLVMLLVDAGADINRFSRGYGTPLTAACRGGNSDVVRYLISKGATAKRNLADTGPIPVHWLIMFEEDELEPMLSLLLEHPGSINAPSTETVEMREHYLRPVLSPIYFAIQARYYKLVEVLLNANAITKWKSVISPLDLAASLGFPEIAALLLERHGPSSIVSPLIHQGLGNSIQMLLQNGSSIREMFESTIDIVLKSKYSDINVIDGERLTPLAHAIGEVSCDSGLDLLEVLINRGAELKSSEGRIVQSLAQRDDRHSGSILKLLLTTGRLKPTPSLLNEICGYGHVGMLKASIDSGIDVNALDISATGTIGALHSSILVPGNYEIIRALLDHGANIDILIEKQTALETAIMSPIGDGDVIDLFIERGASLDSIEETTILMTAARLASKINGAHIMFHLLRHNRVKALINTPLKKEKWVTPLHLACLGHDFESINALLQAGATIDMSRPDNPITIVRISGRLPEPNWNDQDRDFDPYQHQLRAERTMLLLLDRVKPGHRQTPLHVACLLGNYQRVVELIDDGADVWAGDVDNKTPIGHIDLKAIDPKEVANDPLSVQFLANIHKIHKYLQTKMVEATARAIYLEETEYNSSKHGEDQAQDDSPEELVARHTKRLENCKNELGENDHQTLRQMSDLSDAYQLTEDGYAQAESLEIELFERRKGVLRDDDPDLFESRSSQVRFLHNAQKLDEAKKYAEQYIQLAIKEFGDDHIATDIARLDLWNIECSLLPPEGILAEQIRHQTDLYQKMLQREEVDTHHRTVLMLQVNVAHACYALGRWDEGFLEVKWLVGALETIKRDKFPELFSWLLNLGKTCERHASWDAALLIYDTMLRHSKKTRGELSYYTTKALEAMVAMQKTSGNLDEAAGRQLELVEILKRKHGFRNLETLRGVTGLASIYMLQGRLAEENILQQQVASTMEDMFGSIDLQTLGAKDSLVSILDRRQHYDKAVVVARDVVEGYKLTLGDADPKTLAAKTHLAILVTRLSHGEEAIEMQEELLEELESIHGRNTEESARALVNLGAMYLQDSRIPAAEAVFHRAHTIYTDLQGAESLGVSRCLAFLARACVNDDRREEATSFHSQALEIETKIRGPDHSETLSLMQSLSYDYIALDRFDQALELNVQVLNGYQVLYGEHHKDVIQATFDIGTTYQCLEQYAEAEQYYKQAVAGFRKLLGDSDNATISSLETLSLLYADMNQWSDVLPLAQEIFTRNLEKHGSDHPKTAAARQGLVAAYIFLEMWSEMADLQEEAIKILKRTLGTDHADTIDAMADLAMAYDNLGYCDFVIELYLVILAYRRANLIYDHDDTMHVMRDLATAYVEIEDYAKAVPLREELLKMHRGAVGEDGEDCVVMKTKLANVYWHEDSLDEAEALEVEVLETRTRLNGEEDQATLDAMESLARTYVKKKDYDNAESLYLRLLSIQQKTSTTPLDPDVLKTQKLVEDMYFLAGRYHDAKQFATILLDAMRDLAPQNNGKGILSAVTDMRNICEKLKEKKVVKEMDKLIEKERERRKLNWSGDRQIYLVLEKLKGERWNVELPDPLPIKAV